MKQSLHLLNITHAIAPLEYFFPSKRQQRPMGGGSAQAKNHCSNGSLICVMHAARDTRSGKTWHVKSTETFRLFPSSQSKICPHKPRRAYAYDSISVTKNQAGLFKHSVCSSLRTYPVFTRQFFLIDGNSTPWHEYKLHPVVSLT